MIDIRMNTISMGESLAIINAGAKIFSNDIDRDDKKSDGSFIDLFSKSSDE